MIYFDNAATTKLDDEAFKAMEPYLTNDYGNASQPYSFSRDPKIALRKAREQIASCINAYPDEIFFTSCGTESDNWAIKGYCISKGYANSTVITSVIEHHAILNSCASIEKLGAKVIYLPANKEGIIEKSTLNKYIQKESLVSVMFVNNEIGSIQNIKELSKIAHDNNCLFHTDAVQAVGHLPIDVKDLDIDMLSASAHKFNGPKGIGFLYIRRGINIAQLIDGGSQENGNRAGTENIASIVGMAIALKNNCTQLANNLKRVKELDSLLVSTLEEMKVDFVRNGSPDGAPGNISLSFFEQDGEQLLHLLDLKGYCVSTGSACDGEKNQLSHVMKAINANKKYAKGTIRISLSKDNTEIEILQFCKDLYSILDQMKNRF